MGSALARVAMLSAPTTPATAMPTITMKTISSTSDIPCSARGRWRRAWRSAMHIPRFGLDRDLPRRVVGDGAGQGDGHRSVGDGAPQAVEAEVSHWRKRETGGRLLAHYCALVGERAIGVAKSDWQAWTWQAPAENSRRNGTVTPVQVTALLGAGPPSRLPTSVAQVAASLYVRPAPMLG